ncbi:MAG: hypothetical protein HOG99_18675 [Gemmatimonadetes bacterium]|nr:hypothetical protein [Gemmatimonadota bacterium]
MTLHAGNRGFVRTHISSFERGISIALVLSLGAIGTAIYLSGQTYDESLFGLDPAALAAPAAGRTPANTIVIPSPTTTATAATALQGPISWLNQLRVSGWERMGEIESFDAADLYVKINGRAEQYLAYDVVGLDCASLTDASGNFVDVFLYEMGTPARAFGIYAVELDPAAPSVKLGRGGYQSGASFFFWQGGFYVQILASTADEAMARSAQQMAAGLTARVPDHGKPVPGMDSLPREGRIPGSLQYMVRDGLSLPFLTETWTADYLIDGQQVTLFLSLQPSAQAVDNVVEGYRGYLGDFDAQISETTQGDGIALFGDMDGYYDVVLSGATSVAGAVLLEDPDLARMIAAQWLPSMIHGRTIDVISSGEMDE